MPKVILLTDASYEEDTLSLFPLDLRLASIKAGYRLCLVRVPLKTEGILHALQSCPARTRYVCTSPLVSLFLSKQEQHHTFPFTLVGLQANQTQTAYFDFTVSFTGQTPWLTAFSQVRQAKQLGILVGEQPIFPDPPAIPSDLKFFPMDGEDDQAFSIRILDAVQNQPILHIIAPSFGPWALTVLKNPGLLWTVDASCKAMVPSLQLEAVVVDDVPALIGQILLAKDDAKTIEVGRILVKQ